MTHKQLDDRIRVGDFVKVKVPKFVVRVGYPKSLVDYERELAESPEKQELISNLFEAIAGDDQVWHNQGGRKHRSRYRVESELAYLMAKRDGFGGRERAIHWMEYPEHEGMECTVEEMRTVCTGSYYPPSGGHSFSGMFGEEDDWYEPGGLSEMKRHRLARVNLYATTAPLIFRDGDHRTLELPVYHLEKLRSATTTKSLRGMR